MGTDAPAQWSTHSVYMFTLMLTPVHAYQQISLQVHAVTCRGAVSGILSTPMWYQTVIPGGAISLWMERNITLQVSTQSTCW